MSSPFLGDPGNLFAHAGALTFTTVEAVVVSGSGPNLCGHMLLRVDGFYFHVAGVYDYPRVMTESGYRHYLASNTKTELSRVVTPVVDRGSAKNQLLLLLQEKWLWLVVPNNCADFVEEVMQAGNVDFGLISNCPVQLMVKVRQQNARAGKVLTSRGYR